MLMNVAFEAMLKEAVKANFQAKMMAMPSEEELMREHPPSVEHIRKMNALFAWERRRNTMRKLLTFAKAAAIVLCAAITLFFAALMFNTQVRAAVLDTIVQFFEGFTRIEFIEPHEPANEARDFTLKYLPQGYTLTGTEEYGNNCMTMYSDTDGNMLILNVVLPDTLMIDNDYLTHYTVIHDGITYHINQTQDMEHTSGIVWVRDDFVFSLNGPISIDELLKTAYSLE
jgi:hypothetical protein